MPAQNTEASYGAIARTFHWLTALLIFTAFPLGMIAEAMPYDTAEALAEKARLFSIHKTLGTLVFFVALARILWALTQKHPAPLHPNRRLETLAAETVHWALYISLVAVPLSGWIHHAAVDGFAPILWPFGQNLPFVPKSETVSGIATMAHVIFTKVLLAAVLLHIAGALKHVFIDRDGTLGRMTHGRPAGAGHGSDGPKKRPFPLLFASFLYLLAFGAAWQIATPAPATQTAGAAPAAATAGANWQVQEGALSITVKQMGSAVEGSFANWQAAIAFDESPTDGKNGQVEVVIDTTSLTLGSVTQQAKDKDFFDTATFPEARFTADILPAATGYEARGTLVLRGVEKPVTLPFTLVIEGDSARMEGEARLDRRDFGMGEKYPDESSVGFEVVAKVVLTATRN